MKLFCLLLNLYLLTVALLPCEDAVVPGNQLSTEVQKAHTEDNPEEHCPPFCTCTCCSASKVVVIHLVNSSPFMHDERATLISPPVQPPVKVSLPIWQPPRLQA